MAINFPKDRPEAGLGSGPLQNGDVWTNKSIDYTWVVTPSGVGAWSSRGINVDPNSFLTRSDQFGGDVSGTYDNLTVNSAANADTADQLNNKLTLKFIGNLGDITETIYDGTKAETFTFTDTDDATSVIQLNGGTGIDIEPNNTIVIEDGVARRSQQINGYVVDGAGNNLRVTNADNANDSDRLGGTQATDYATKAYVDNNSGGGGSQDLQSVLDNGSEAKLTGADRLKLTHDNGEMFMRPDRQWLVCRSNNGDDALYKPGAVELMSPQPYVDFKRTGSSGDFEARILQSGTNLIISTPFGALFHQDNNGAYHQIGSGGGGGGGTVIAGVSNVNRASQPINPISVSPTTGNVVIGWNGLTTGQLTDVTTAGVTNGQVLAWDSSVSQWKPTTIETGGDTESVFPGEKVYTVDTSIDFAFAFESAYNAALSNGGHVFVPGGTHKLSRNVKTNSNSKVHQVTVFGPAYDVAEINCNIYQLWFRHPTNLRDLKIRGATLTEGGGSQWSVPLQSSGARGMILFYRNSDASEEDMDSSILNCDIKVGAMQNGYAIVYRGRNLKMHDCRLTRQKQNSVEGCLRMIYNVTEAEEIQGRLGWRRCSINDNTFHAWDESVCITVDFSQNFNGNVNCYGLIVSNNTLENGGTFMQTLGSDANKRLVACNITDNTMHFIKPVDMPCIDIKASNSMITGNAVTLRGRVSGGVAVNGATDSNNINGDSSDNIIHNPKPFNLDNA